MKTLSFLARLCAVLAGVILTAITLVTCFSLIGRNTIGVTLAGDYVTLDLPTFSATAEMAAVSRAMGGYHIPIDNDVGLKVGRDIAVKAGNNIVSLEVAETQRWRRTASTVETDWVAEMKGKNIDGAKLVAEARALIAKYQR